MLKQIKKNKGEMEMTMQEIYKRTDGMLVDHNGKIGTIVGYSGEFLVAAFRAKDGCWSLEDRCDIDYIDKRFHNSAYKFAVVRPSQIISEKPVKIRLKTLEELQKDPKVKFRFTEKGCVSYISSDYNLAIINDNMLKHLGKTIEITDVAGTVRNGWTGPDGWTYYPWMYVIVED